MEHQNKWTFVLQIMRQGVSQIKKDMPSAWFSSHQGQKIGQSQLR
jgi:hypothetical protein